MCVHLPDSRHLAWGSLLKMTTCSFAKQSAFAAAEIDRLVKDKDVSQLCPYYLDLQGEGQRLQVHARLVEKL